MMWQLWLYMVLLILVTLTCMFIPVYRQIKGRIERHHWLGLSSVYIIIPFIAWLLYQNWGSAELLRQAHERRALQPKIAKLMQELKTPEQVIARLKQRLDDDPSSAKGWYLLGRVYFINQQFQQAANAFRQASQLREGDEQILLHYLQALFFAHQFQLNDESQKLVKQLQAINPSNPALLNILAMNEFKHKNYQQAIDHWKQVLNQLPESANSRDEILKAISEAQLAQQGDGKIVVRDIDHQTRIKATVTVDKALQQQLKGGETIFIVAKDPSQAGPPLAVIKQTIAHWPIEVELSDAQSMLPSRSLSKAQHVQIIARISRSGHPIAEAGDIEGKTSTFEATHLPPSVEVHINHKLK